MKGVTPVTIDQQADAIVEFLFTNGAGQHADRLVLTRETPQTHDIGQWDRVGVKQAIVVVLNNSIREAVK